MKLKKARTFFRRKKVNWRYSSSREVELTSPRKSKMNRHESNNDKSWNEKDGLIGIPIY